jgi:hypothetical protein
LLNLEIFYSLKEAQLLIELWRNHYNTVRPQLTGIWSTSASCSVGPTYPNPVSWTIISSGTYYRGRSQGYKQ